LKRPSRGEEKRASGKKKRAKHPSKGLPNLERGEMEIFGEQRKRPCQKPKGGKKKGGKRGFLVNTLQTSLKAETNYSEGGVTNKGSREEVFKKKKKKNTTKKKGVPAEAKKCPNSFFQTKRLGPAL